MLERQFKFFHKDCPECVYTAKVNEVENDVDISWDFEGDKGSMIYDVEETENFIKHKTWIIVK